MENLQDLEIRVYRPTDKANVIGLWQDCGLIVPWNNPEADIARKVKDSPELFFVAELSDELISTCMAGFDGHRGWIYFLAVKIQYRQRGIATKMVIHAESALLAVGCPKLELMVRESNNEVMSFYQKNAYQKEPVVVLSKRLMEDKPHKYGA